MVNNFTHALTVVMYVGLCVCLLVVFMHVMLP